MYTITMIKQESANNIMKGNTACEVSGIPEGREREWKRGRERGRKRWLDGEKSGMVV